MIGQEGGSVADERFSRRLVYSFSREPTEEETDMSGVRADGERRDIQKCGPPTEKVAKVQLMCNGYGIVSVLNLYQLHRQTSSFYLGNYINSVTYFCCKVKR
jgi:hypothetical protein